MVDGRIDYSHYGRLELLQALETIDRERCPLNYANLTKALEALPPDSQMPPDNAGIPTALEPLSWETFLTTAGRSNRTSYWLLGSLPFFVLGLLLGFAQAYFTVPSAWVLALDLVVVWPQAVFMARRLHDLNISAWWATGSYGLTLLLSIIPATRPWALYVLVTLLCLVGLPKGTAGPNRFGTLPR
jgi:uncharacterized membrane protein YhaH (DUF805 family)